MFIFFICEDKFLANDFLILLILVCSSTVGSSSRQSSRISKAFVSIPTFAIGSSFFSALSSKSLAIFISAKQFIACSPYVNRQLVIAVRRSWNRTPNPPNSSCLLHPERFNRCPEKVLPTPVDDTQPASSLDPFPSLAHSLIRWYAGNSSFLYGAVTFLNLGYPQCFYFGIFVFGDCFLPQRFGCHGLATMPDRIKSGKSLLKGQ